ncbi:carboxymuconolactone decarboxylase family protein [Shewanella sp.]|uniref:carboxymuconolactone decarboxylase family protein n=1 Tax=Shewanella sp. TaxID=50422 RepID=UPI003A96A726
MYGSVSITEAHAIKSDFDVRQQALIPIAAYTAAGEIDPLNASLNVGLATALTVNEIKGIQVQMYAYASFPRSLNGLSTFVSVLQERKSKGIKDVEVVASQLGAHFAISNHLCTAKNFCRIAEQGAW